MSKRTNSSTEIPPPKRSRRPAGFRVARPAPVSSQPSSSTIRSLFVTVNQPDEQRGNLEAQNRVLLTSTASTQGSSTSPSQESHVQLPTEPNTEFQDIPQIQDEPIPIHEPTVKPKRKRNMTNAVCYWLSFRA
jgi:hypothetical protein